MQIWFHRAFCLPPLISDFMCKPRITFYAIAVCQLFSMDSFIPIGNIGISRYKRHMGDFYVVVNINFGGTLTIRFYLSLSNVFFNFLMFERGLCEIYFSKLLNFLNEKLLNPLCKVSFEWMTKKLINKIISRSLYLYWGVGFFRFLFFFIHRIGWSWHSGCVECIFIYS